MITDLQPQVAKKHFPVGCNKHYYFVSYKYNELAGVRRAYEGIIDISGFGNGRNQEALHQSGGEGYDVGKSAVYSYGGNTRYLLERINDTGFRKSLMAYINDNGMVIGVSAGSLIFANNLENNLGLIDTKMDVHCETGEKRGKLILPLKEHMQLTNTCALVIRDLADGMEIVGE